MTVGDIEALGSFRGICPTLVYLLSRFPELENKGRLRERGQGSDLR